MAKKKIPDKFQIWIDARKRFHLSHAHIQMARELGMNPKNFGKLANNEQEPWKAPLPEFIERIYYKRFGKRVPEVVKPMEPAVKDVNRKKEERRRKKQAALLESKAAAAENQTASDSHAAAMQEPLPL